RAVWVGPALPRAGAARETTPPADKSALSQVIEQARKGRPADATQIANTIADPLARKLAEWVILRSDDSNAGFERYAAFLNVNPSWPSIGMLRRRAERTLWEERRDPATVRNFFASQKP